MSSQDVYSSDDEVFVGKLSLKETGLPNVRGSSYKYEICGLPYEMLLKYHSIIKCTRFESENTRFLAAYVRGNLFYGWQPCKEIKKQFKVETHRQTLPCAPTHAIQNCDTSLKIVETKSEPDIASVISTDFCGTADQMEDDSFLKIEKLVSEMPISPSSYKKEELDNTLEVVDLILRQGITTTLNSNSNLIKHNPNQILVEEGYKNDNENNIIIPTSPASQYCTPMKHLNSYENIKTPVSKTKIKSPCFKTPANPVSIKKPSSISVKKTPSKNNYQHIASPIAAYIKNSPQVPLVKDVHPKKPLPGVSSIPKLLKPKLQTYNKENINLPTIAYKSAKTVKVIHVPERDKLPQSHWAKKVTSTIPKPLVLKHNHREVNSAETQIKCNQEDSFANLTLHQADVSVCTQKSARP